MQHLRTAAMVVVLVFAGSNAIAQDCATQATIGQFDVEFQGAGFDGSDTKFTYCITGLDDPALSNWLLSLALECIDPDDLVGCGPEPCFYQVDDPNLQLTGIKWDEVVVDPGETECFDFSLAGDWTNQVGNVEIGLKAGQGVHFGDICGPICLSCEASLEVVGGGSATPTYRLRVEHRRPPTVQTEVRYTLYNSRGRRIARWQSDRFELAYGSVWEDSGPLPVRRTLKPGIYELEVQIRGMSRWQTRRTQFQVRD